MASSRRKFLQQMAGFIGASLAPKEVMQASASVAKAAPSTLAEAYTARYSFYDYFETFAADFIKVIDKAEDYYRFDQERLLSSGAEHAFFQFRGSVTHFNCGMHNLRKELNPENPLLSFRDNPDLSNLDNAVDEFVERYFKTIKWQADVYQRSAELEMVNSILGTSSTNSTDALRQAIKRVLTEGRSYIVTLDDTAHKASWSFQFKEYQKQVDAYEKELTKKKDLNQEELQEYIEHFCLSNKVYITTLPNKPCHFRFEPANHSLNSDDKEYDLTNLFKLLSAKISSGDEVIQDSQKRGRINTAPCSILHEVLEKARGELISKYHYKELYFNDSREWEKFHIPSCKDRGRLL